MPSLSKLNLPILKARIEFTTTGTPCQVSDISKPVKEMQPSSRATRLVDDSTRFLNVAVAQKGLSPSRLSNGLKWALDHGLTVDGRKYSFLGYTDSQLKSGHLMFFREGEGWTVQRVLAMCGDLEPVYIQSGYGKWSARLGLSFSSTMEGLDVPPELAVEIMDLKALDGSLTTDGCGMICNSFAGQLCNYLNIPDDTAVFQIRRGGIKGLLVRYPDAIFYSLCPKTSSGLRPWIAYRPSMLKYKRGPTHIEVSNVSGMTPSRAYLNVQFITLLLTLGISIKIFESLLESHLESIKSIASDRDRAISYLRSTEAELDSQRVGLHQELLEMLLACQDMNEPMVAVRIRQFQNMQYKSLSEKLRIEVKDSCWLFGVVDERGILEEDEVYVNLPGRFGVQCRRMVVSRSPAYSPGDIRILQGVDRPELAHLRDCIVFSRKCRRSVADTMGGGDLDGDRYWVSWEPRLIPDRTMPPKDRLSGKKATRVYHLNDMKAEAIRTFTLLRGSRLLGFMSTTWSDIVDANPHTLAKHPFAQALVPLLETAMDIVKSGEDAQILQDKYNVLLGKYGKPPSSKNNGIPSSPFFKLRKQIPTAAKATIENFVPDPDLARPEYNPSRWDHHYSTGREIMREFNSELSTGIQMEKASDEKTDGRPPEKQTDLVKQKFIKQYFTGDPQKQEDERLRASAWYALGYDESKSTFAWLGARYLHRIKAERTQGGGLVISVGPRSQSTMCGSTDGSRSYRELSPAVSGQTPVTSRASSGEPLTPGNDNVRLDGPSPLQTKPLGQSIVPMATIATPSQSFNDFCDATTDKPTRPVATMNIPTCLRPQHVWGRAKAGGTWRHYTCQTCMCVVKEIKRDGIWCPREIAGPQSASRMEVSINTGTPVHSRLRVVTPQHSPHVASPSPPSAEAFPNCMTDKPTQPVATENLPPCLGPQHVWGRRGCIQAGGTWRKYTCADCHCIVKEKKSNGIWCPNGVLTQP